MTNASRKHLLINCLFNADSYITFKYRVDSILFYNSIFCDTSPKQRQKFRGIQRANLREHYLV